MNLKKEKCCKIIVIAVILDASRTLAWFTCRRPLPPVYAHLRVLDLGTRLCLRRPAWPPAKEQLAAFFSARPRATSGALATDPKREVGGRLGLPGGAGRRAHWETGRETSDPRETPRRPPAGPAGLRSGHTGPCTSNKVLLGLLVRGSFEEGRGQLYPSGSLSTETFPSAIDCQSPRVGADCNGET